MNEVLMNRYISIKPFDWIVDIENYLKCNYPIKDLKIFCFEKNIILIVVQFELHVLSSKKELQKINGTLDNIIPIGFLKRVVCANDYFEYGSE